MKKKILIIIGVMFVVLGICIAIILNNTEETITNVSEYIPEIEISDDELRKTIITLYFRNGNTNELSTEARLIDSKELLRDTYNVLIKMLINGPKDNNLECLIPKDTKIIGTKLKGDCLVVDFSKEFLTVDKSDSVKVSNLIYSIVNTLTELKEIAKVKFLIEGEEVDAFNEIGIDFKSEFVRND